MARVLLWQTYFFLRVWIGFTRKKNVEISVMLEGKWVKLLQAEEYHGPKKKKKDNNITDIKN